MYCAHNLGKIYFDYGAKVHKDYFVNLLSLVYKNPVLKVEGLGSAGRVNLLKQTHKNRYIVHILYAPVHQKEDVQVVEEMPVVKSVEIRDGKQVSHSVKNKLSIFVDQFSCHKAIVINF